MTTPPTPAGWYPDPDGSGGQRYWDGSVWTEHRSPAPPPAPAPTPAPEPTRPQTDETMSWPTELPPWPTDMKMPSWDEAASEKPTAVVKLPAQTPEPEAEQPESGDSTAAESDAAPEAPESETTESETSATETSATDSPEPEAAEPDSPEPEADEPGEQPTTVVRLPEQATTVVPRLPAPPAAPLLPPPPPGPPPGFQPPPPPPGPPPFEPAPFEPAAFTDTTPAPAGSPLKGYLAAVGALLVILIAVLVWAFVFAKPETSQLGSPGTSATAEPSETTESSAAPETTETTTESDEPPAPAAGEVVDGTMTITQDGVEIGPSVIPNDPSLPEVVATGEFVVVHLTLTNNGEMPATFLADQQVLTADGQTFSPSTDGTFYLNGTVTTTINPGESASISVAFDVPVGSVPESLQVHGDLLSPGAVLVLS